VTAAAVRVARRGHDMRFYAYWLLVAFVFAVPWENAIHVSGVGRITKVIGFAAFTLWTISVIARGRLRQPDAFQKAYFLFLIWNGMTLYWSLDPGATLTGFRTYTELFGLMLMCWDLFDSKATIRPAIQAYVLGAYVAAGSIIVNFLQAAPDPTPEHQRFQALGYQTDGIALVVAIAGPAAWYLATSEEGPRWSALRIVNFAYVPTGLFAVALTGTRGATLASLPTAAFILWSLRRTSVRPAIALAVLVVGVTLLVGFAPRTQLERISSVATIGNLQEGALSGRFGLWTESHEVFREHPLNGAGLDAHRAAIPTGKEAHNTYVSVVAETGVIGFALFFGVLLSVFVRVSRLRGWDGRYWATQVAVLAIGAMSLSLEDSKSVWVFLSMAVATGAAAARPDWRPARMSFGAAAAPAHAPPETGDEVDRAISDLMHEVEAEAAHGWFRPHRPPAGKG
jgi:O-antigen ligase